MPGAKMSFILAGLAACALALPTNNAACYHNGAAESCGTPTKRSDEVSLSGPVTACFLNDVSVQCDHLSKRSVESVNGIACTLAGNTVACETAQPHKRSASVEERGTDIACTLEGNKLHCPTVTSLRKRALELPCTLEGSRLACPLAERSVDVEERSVSIACTLDGNRLACPEVKRSVEIAARGVTEVACTLDGNRLACPDVKRDLSVQAREAEPICMEDGPCEPTVGNSRFHSMASPVSDLD